MHGMKLRKYLGLGASALLLVSNGAWAGQVLDYSIRWSTADDRYHVYMKPAETPVNDRSMTAQVTIVVPHAEGSQSFQVKSLDSLIQGASWTQNSRTNGPIENSGSDYLSFTLTANDAAAFNWQAGIEVKVFSFSNTGACIGPVALLDNETDPFVLPVNNGGTNSARTNPGNQFSNTGWADTMGENNYRANYGVSADCEDSLDDDLDGLKNGDEKALGSDPYNPDTDGDGIVDGKEAGDDIANPRNTDGDTLIDILDNDDDNDGVPTLDEDYANDSPLNDDTDGDNIPDYLDADDDGDGVLTRNESYDGDVLPANDDTDGDNIPDYLDTDDDGDGILTYHENYNGSTPENDDTDGDNIPDYLDDDDDGDGKLSKDEGNDPNVNNHPSDAVDGDGDNVPDYLDGDDTDGPKGDVDGDGVSNGDEDNQGSDKNNPDDDGDGILTKDENYNGGSPADDDTDNDGTPDYLDTDDDNDGILTRHENYNGSTPVDDDTDGDNISDYLDTDDDGDGKLSKDEGNDPNKNGAPDDAVDTDGDQLPDYLDATANIAALQVKVMLQGAFDGSNGLMADDLRIASLIPATQPYNSDAFSYHGNERLASDLLSTSGANAIVDWVLVELRETTNTGLIVARQAALVQRDGDVVDSQTGSTTLRFEGMAPGEYLVSIRHRNHLGTMASQSVMLQANPPLVDFTSSQTQVYGSHARTTYQQTELLWAGNADGNTSLVSNGPGSDSVVLLGTVLLAPGNDSLSTNYIMNGYSDTDLNLDGKTIVAGPGNDLNLLASNILLHPVNDGFNANFIIPERLP